MEEIKIEFKELDEFTIEDTREVVIQEVPVYPELENLTVTPSGEEQVFNHENSYGYDEVRVEAVPSEALEISPTTENQEFNGIYSNVKVNAVTNEIDSNIVPENIKDGVEILGVKGSFVGGKYAPRYIYQGNLFYNYNGTELDYETANLDTSNMTNMSGMFYGCQKLTALDVSGFDTSNVTNMSSMFTRCEALATLDVSNFNTSKVTNMSGMFYRCYKLATLDVSNFDTSNVTNMYNMFAWCYKLAALDVSNFDTSNVTNMSYMFNDSLFISLDLSNFDTSNVTNMSSMFSGCYKLTYLDIRNFTFDKVTDYSNMFSSRVANCEIIVKSDTEKQWLTSKFTFLTNIKTVAEYEAS